MTMDKKSLSERGIRPQFITPALRKAGWDEMHQIREEVSFTESRPPLGDGVQVGNSTHKDGRKTQL